MSDEINQRWKDFIPNGQLQDDLDIFHSGTSFMYMMMMMKKDDDATVDLFSPSVLCSVFGKGPSFFRQKIAVQPKRKLSEKVKWKTTTTIAFS